MEQRGGLRGFGPLPPAGCGAAGSSGPPSLRLSIASTAGSPVELTVPRGETVEGLRTRISQRLRLHTDRIVLLHKDRHLTAGRLLDQSVSDGSRLTLVPVVEAGLVCSSVRAERTTMDVLESLTDLQISDFLSGRSPLTISLRVGAHMMYVQLQLSAQDVKELHAVRDPPAPCGAELHAGLPGGAGAGPPPSASPASQTAPASTDSPDWTRSGPQRPRTSWAAPPCLPPAVRCHSPTPPAPPPNVPSSWSLPPGRPQPSSPRQAAAPVCSTGPGGSSPGPQSPAPAPTFSESGVDGSSAAEPPGAVIETFVSHSPGVFSGTFSGTLAPCSQSVAHPRRGISIILQILNDLLRAASHHQGAPATLSSSSSSTSSSSSCSSSCSTPHLRPASGSRGLTVTSRTESLGKPAGAAGLSGPSSSPPPPPPPAPPAGEEARLQLSSSEENRTLHCKLERLQRLMRQRRLRRRARPYQHRHLRP